MFLQLAKIAIPLPSSLTAEESIDQNLRTILATLIDEKISLSKLPRILYPMQSYIRLKDLLRNENIYKYDTYILTYHIIENFPVNFIIIISMPLLFIFQLHVRSI